LPAYADPITGGDKSVALSPDGSEVAFIRVPDWNHESAEGLFVRPTTAGHARRLTDDAMSAGYPRFSPDGTTILFTQGMDGGTHDGPLWTVPAAGGTPTPLRSPGDGLWAFEADWAPDGTRIVFKVLGPGWGHNELWTALADGSDPQPLWIGDTGMTAETPDWGPAPAP
jgi:tricorn protease